MWKDWLGLPHIIGADPREGKGACCLVICKIMLDEAGFKTPAIDTWIDLAHQKKWIDLQIAFDEFCEVLPGPELNAITLVKNGTHGLGLGIVVEDNKLLLPHHRKGVVALPIAKLRLMQYRKLRQ